MSTEQFSKLEADRQFLKEAQAEGGIARLSAYLKLSGPGWLQSALTLGGGSLSGSLYLGVLAGFSLLWLQPLAMILGIVMLSAIGYVTMSTGERPFRAINLHVNPVLGWGWALASLVANMVWVLPQYSLANGVLQQNLFPRFLGPDSELGDFRAKLVVCGTIFVLSTAITWSYGRGGLGVRLYELMLKIMVAVIVACFVGVVIKMSLSAEGLEWSRVLAGFVPNPGALFNPAPTFEPLLAATGEYRSYWSGLIVTQQRDVLITAAATAVGINMTFLFPYSILKRGWGKEFRGLAIFDLSTGMFIPFILATSCVVIASATQFHARPQPGLLAPEELAVAGVATEGDSSADDVASGRQQGEFKRLLRGRLDKEYGQGGLNQKINEAITVELAKRPEPDKQALALGLAIPYSEFEKRAEDLPARLGERIHQLRPADQSALSTTLGKVRFARILDTTSAEIAQLSDSGRTTIAAAVDLGGRDLMTHSATDLRKRLHGLAPAKKQALEVELGARELETLSGDAYVTTLLRTLPTSDRRLAATLVKRDAFDLAQSLKPLLDKVFSNVVFGVGVLAMALSTITLLMLVSGLVICELLGVPPTGWPYRLGCLAAATGVLGPFLWSKAAFWLAVPTSVFGFTLLPIAYLTFFLLMNQKSLLEDQLPRGGARLTWNVLMGLTAIIVSGASVYMIWQKAGWVGMGVVAAFGGAVAVAHVLRDPDARNF